MGSIRLTGGCANVAARARDSAGERWLLGSVSDDPYDIRTAVVVDRSGPIGYVATELQPATGVGMTSRGYVVAEGERGRGVNATGLALVWAFVREQDTAGGSMTSGDFTREALAGCRTVADAVELAASADRAFSGAFFFADAAGDCAQVEIGRQLIHVTRPDAPVANVNCYQSSVMRGHQTPSGSLADEAAPNARRLRAALTQLASVPEPATVTDLATALSDHTGAEIAGAGADWVFPSHGFSICNHGSFGAEREPGSVAFGTVSAEILDPSTRTLWYCYGWPCGRTDALPDQPLQDRSWGRFVPFRLDELPDGYMTTLEGELTPAAAEAITGQAIVSAPAAELAIH